VFRSHEEYRAQARHKIDSNSNFVSNIISNDTERTFNPSFYARLKNDDNHLKDIYFSKKQKQNHATAA